MRRKHKKEKGERRRGGKVRKRACLIAIAVFEVDGRVAAKGQGDHLELVFLFMRLLATADDICEMSKSKKE